MPFRLCPVTGENSWAIRGERRLIGRSPECDVKLDHPTVSKVHATIFWLGDRLLLKDLSSTNGTLVNGNLIQQSFLQDGDTITFGGVAVRVLQEGQTAPFALGKGNGQEKVGVKEFETRHLPKEIPHSWHLVNQASSLSELKNALETLVRERTGARLARVYDVFDEDSGAPDLVKVCHTDHIHFLKRLCMASGNSQVPIWTFALPVCAEDEIIRAVLYLEHEQNIPFDALHESLETYLNQAAEVFDRLMPAQLGES